MTDLILVAIALLFFVFGFLARKSRGFAWHYFTTIGLWILSISIFIFLVKVAVNLYFGKIALKFI